MLSRRASHYRHTETPQKRMFLCWGQPLGVFHHGCGWGGILLFVGFVGFFLDCCWCSGVFLWKFYGIGVW